MSLIKICGMTEVELTLEIAQQEVDMLGFVFAQSRRQVSVEQASDIINELNKLDTRPATVGVFVNEEPGRINQIAAGCGLDIVQLSGDESWDYCRYINYPVIQVLHVIPDTDSEKMLGRIEEGYRADLPEPFICMLDARFDSQYGGSGQTFDWEIAAKVAATYPIIIAGGLSAANVGYLIDNLNPLGVDASSGLETNGKKDISKVKDFIGAVRSTGREPGENRHYLSKYLLKR